MSTTAIPIPVISLSEGFGSLVVQGPNIKVEILPNGNVNVQTSGRVTTGPCTATAASSEALKVGASMPDGSLYAGVSPDTAKPMFATPKDAPLTYTFDQAHAYCAGLDAHGHKDWRLPTKAELNALFHNRAAIGDFDTSRSFPPAGWYWSSSRDGYGAWAQRFSDGHQHLSNRVIASSLRCVRG